MPKKMVELHFFGMRRITCNWFGYFTRQGVCCNTASTMPTVTASCSILVHYVCGLFEVVPCMHGTFSHFMTTFGKYPGQCRSHDKKIFSIMSTIFGKLAG